MRNAPLPLHNVESNSHVPTARNSRIFATLARAGLLFGLAALLTPFASAQAVRFKAPQDRVTIPLNFSGTAIVTNLVTVSALGGNAVNFDVTGLPAGATYSLTDAGGNPLLSTLITTNLWIQLNLTNVANGTYTFSLNGSGGAVNNILFTLQAGLIWGGSTNAAVDGAGNWSDASKWLGGAAPGAANQLVFNDSGGQTNVLVSGALVFSSIVDTDTTISSLRFAQTTNATSFHAIQIASGRTLSVTGTGGFSFQRDYIADSGFGNMVNSMFVTIAGTNAALVVSNSAANFALLNDGSGNNAFSTLDLSQLDRLTVDVSRMALGDYTAYPNYANYSFQNSYNGIPRRFLPNVLFARTNFIRATFVDPNNYTNADDRRFSFSFLNSEQGGTTTQPLIQLGITNVFFCDSVNFVGANQQGNLRFNPAFTTNGIQCYAYFRSPSGGRMSVFSLADAAGTNGANTNIKNPLYIDFGSGGGSLDLLADRFYIGRDRRQIIQGQNPNYQGFFSMGKGVVDVNTCILGFQEYSGQTNTGTFNGYCEGRIVVSNTAVFKVNGTMTLGYCTQTNINGLGSAGNTTWGQVNIQNGGTVMVSNVLVGVPALTSKNNFFFVDNGSLIVSNTVAGPAKMLDTLTLQNGSSLTLHADGAALNSAVYATNMVVPAGQTNLLRIASIKNFSGPPIPLITFVSGGPSFSGVVMPGSLSGTLINSTNTGVFPNQITISLVVITNTPKNLLWQGTFGSDWDTTNKNWLDLDTLVQTNFSVGDFVRFDDSSSVNNINLADPLLIPGAVTVSNTTKFYTFAGTGALQGSAIVTKTGTNTLEINGSATLSIQVNQGKLSGTNSSSSIGSASIAAGASMDFAGTVNNGVTCAGIANLTGSVGGNLTLLSPAGTITNAGTFNGTLVFQSGTLLLNSGALASIGTSTVVSNATLINAGSIGQNAVNGVLTVNGTFRDLGLGNIFLTTLSVGNNGRFFPGGNGIRQRPCSLTPWNIPRPRAIAEWIGQSFQSEPRRAGQHAVAFGHPGLWSEPKHARVQRLHPGDQQCQRHTVQRRAKLQDVRQFGEQRRYF